MGEEVQGELWVEMLKNSSRVGDAPFAPLLFPQLSPVSGKPRTVSHVLMKFPLADRRHLLFYIVKVFGGLRKLEMHPDRFS